jgi:hypothetical protein
MAVLLSHRVGGAAGSITSIANPAFPDKKKRKGKKKSTGNTPGAFLFIGNRIT